MSDTRKRAFWKSPWFWGAFYGIGFLTVIRPFMRQVPDPPVVQVTLQSFDFVDGGGQRHGLDYLRDGVTVLGFFSTECDVACDERFEMLTRLQRDLDFALGDDGSVRIALITASPGADPQMLERFAKDRGHGAQPWSWFTGTDQAVRALVERLSPVVQPPDEEDPPDAPPKKTDTYESVFIIDSHGGVRGRFPADSRGLAEVFHRSRHVLFSKGAD